MSNVSMHVAETVAAFALLVIGVYLMKCKGLLKAEDSNLFSRLLTQAVLPATIFYQLWVNRLSGATVVPVLIMFLMGVVALILSWAAGTALKFDRKSTGALMIVSSFGSSSLIGYPIIQYAFANNPRALAEGIVISEIGVGLPIFIFCPAVAIWFGELTDGRSDLRKLARDYFRSPIFAAVVLGLLLSRIDLPAGMPFVETAKDAFQMIQGALVVIAAVILGLQLSFRPLKGFGKLIVVSIAIQMLFQPWFNALLAKLWHVNPENTQVLVLVSAMPAAILGPVFAARYNCAASTATLLTFTHIVISPILVPAVFALCSR
ncbi:MAG: AEC family transporter [Lentisphaeria bacterium]